MAFGAAAIPVVVSAGPMKAFPWHASIVWHQLIPALATLLFASTIPSSG